MQKKHMIDLLVVNELTGKIKAIEYLYLFEL